jgi:hypothetical protein
MLCAVATGCGIAAERAAEKEAAEKRAAEKRAVKEEAARKEAAEGEAARKKAADEKEEAEKKDAEEKKAAAKKAAEAAANSYVKVKVEVELRGVLTCTDKAAAISIVTRDDDRDRFTEQKWLLDFGQDKELRAKAKGLDGKTVLVEGSAILQHKTHELTEKVVDDSPPGGSRRKVRVPPLRPSVSMMVPGWDLVPKVAVKSLVAATKDCGALPRPDPPVRVQGLGGRVAETNTPMGRKRHGPSATDGKRYYAGPASSPPQCQQLGPLWW